jgi:hypothetical protein
MNQEDLRDRLRVRPFQPFRLHLTDGSYFDVSHPEMMIATRRTAILGLGGQLDQGLPERAVTISLLHIVRAESREAGAGSGQANQN